MNENIDLTKILKNCPKGFKLYSIVHGEVTFSAIENGRYPICTLTYNNSTAYYSSNGKIYATRGECVLFPSKDQRDWSKFTAPWLKKERFDPKTLKAFDKILIYSCGRWEGSFFNRLLIQSTGKIGRVLTSCGSSETYCVPYNDDTKHLLGTKDEAPEFYRYWEE